MSAEPNRNIAMIPARGGSKRIPGKNIKSFHGEPIIARSIRAARESGLFETVMVSTDSEEIAQVARDAGAQVPFLRPAHLSDDFATTMDVIRHTLDHFSDAAALCCLYATAPFVRPQDLVDAHARFVESEADYVFTATEFPFPVQRGFTVTADGAPALLFPEHADTRSQDLPAAYHDAGQFYWCRPSAVHADKPIFGPDARPHLLARERVQDIDTPEDWRFAEAMFALLEGRA